jgi:hypothetical protein
MNVTKIIQARKEIRNNICNVSNKYLFLAGFDGYNLKCVNKSPSTEVIFVRQFNL